MISEEGKVKSEEVWMETFGFLHFNKKWTNPKGLNLHAQVRLRETFHYPLFTIH